MDMQKIPPIHQKRIITFVNHFIINTVSFLNKFLNTCECSLMKLDQRMQTLEATISILETKLNSISALQEIKPSMKLSETKYEQSDTSSPQEKEVNDNTISEEKQDVDPDLLKYYKMCQVGVPVGAVKLKMEQDGYNPELLCF